MKHKGAMRTLKEVLEHLRKEEIPNSNIRINRENRVVKATLKSGLKVRLFYMDKNENDRVRFGHTSGRPKSKKTRKLHRFKTHRITARNVAVGPEKSKSITGRTTRVSQKVREAAETLVAVAEEASVAAAAGAGAAAASAGAGAAAGMNSSNAAMNSLVGDLKRIAFNANGATSHSTVSAVYTGSLAPRAKEAIAEKARIVFAANPELAAKVASYRRNDGMAELASMFSRL